MQQGIGASKLQRSRVRCSTTWKAFTVQNNGHITPISKLPTPEKMALSKEPESRNGLPQRTHREKRDIGIGLSVKIGQNDEHGAEGISSGGRTEEGERHTTASAPTKLEKRANVAGFLAKAYQIFDNPSWSDVCGWGENGETVVIRKQIEFAQRILPLYFNHSNLQSFVRQLNMYNFRKVVQDPNSGEFKHDLFRKGNKHLLHLIKRKQSPGTAGGSSNMAGGRQELDYGDTAGQHGDVESTRASEKARVAGGIMKEADGVLEELVRLRQWQKDMENTVVELKRDNKTLQDENQMLKGQVAEHANQQLVLQNKMQKILFCMYDLYITGIRGPNAHGNSHAASRGITELADSEGDEENKSGGEGNGDVVGDGIGAGKAVKNLTEGGSSGSATSMESGLAQLAALGGESIPGRLNLLDMENPWSTGNGAADGKTRSPVSGSSSDGGSVVGGGALTRNRSWSQSSYEWLRSLRDPDPLGSVASHPAPSSSVAPARAPSPAMTEAKAEGGASPAFDEDVTVAPSKAVDGDGGTSAAISPEMDNRPAKRQRKSESPAANSVDEVDVGAAGNDGDTFGGKEVMRAASFQPNAPISLSTTGGGPIQRTSSFQRNGSGDEGQVWGGGGLSRTLSEGAIQVVSELGELGHSEGEALSKIDSLGFQLANLLDTNEPIMELDEVSMFGDSSGASPSVGEEAGASTGGTDSPTAPGNVASSMSNSNTISVEDGLVSFALSGESSAPAVRVNDAGVETSSANMDDNNVSNSKEDPEGIGGGRGVQSESGTEAAGSVEVQGQAAAAAAAAAAALDSVNVQPGVTVSTYRAEDDDRGNMTIVSANGNPLPIVGSEIA